jgi:hypothetical protein
VASVQPSTSSNLLAGSTRKRLDGIEVILGFCSRSRRQKSFQELPNPSAERETAGRDLGNATDPRGIRPDQSSDPEIADVPAGNFVGLGLEGSHQLLTGVRGARRTP